MSRIQLVILPTVMASFLQAQIWCPPGATWTYEALHDQGGFIRMSYRADTVIDGVAAQVIDRYSATQLAPDFGEPTTSYEAVARITRVQDDVVFTYANSTWDTLYWFGATTVNSYRAPHTTCSPFIIVDTGTDTLSGMPLDWYSIGSVHRIYQRLGYIWHVELTCPGVLLLDPAKLRCYSDVDITVQLSADDCEALVGIDDMAAPMRLLLLPNPGTDRIVVRDGPGADRLTLFDALGRPALDRSIRASTAIDASSLEPGPYIYRVRDAQGRVIGAGRWMKE